MTRSSAVWVTGVEANDLGDDKPTSSRASISLPFDFDDTRETTTTKKKIFSTQRQRQDGT
eukprot:scaffold197348_cov48-Attheya_sp.AAC.2